MSTDSFLEEENPAQIALDEFRRQFGGDDSVFIIYAPKDGNVFSRESLTAIQDLTQDLNSCKISIEPHTTMYLGMSYRTLEEFNLSEISEYKKALEIP